MRDKKNTVEISAYLHAADGNDNKSLDEEDTEKNIILPERAPDSPMAPLYARKLGFLSSQLFHSSV